MIRRKLHAVHQQLALVERTEIGRKRIAKVDGAEQFIVDGIGDGHSVRVLLGGIDAIAMADRNIGVGRGRRSLPSEGVASTDGSCREPQSNQY